MCGRWCRTSIGQHAIKSAAPRFLNKKMLTIDPTGMCSHLQKKLFDAEGAYHPIWTAMQNDPELTAAVRQRQLHIYRNSKKILVLAGKSAPKIIRDDKICQLLPKIQTIRQ